MDSDSKPLLSPPSFPASYQKGNGEVLPLESKYVNEDAESPTPSKASVKQTTLNIAKTCVGTGTLALPFAVSQGGFLFSIIGIGLVAKWNLYSVECLIRCEKILPDLSLDESLDLSLEPEKKDKRKQKEKIDQSFPDGTSTFGKISYYSFGSLGLHFSDFVMLILYAGVGISFIDLVQNLTHNAGYTTGSSTLDLCMIALIIILLSSVPDLGFLHAFSACGLLAVIIAFAVILIYGFSEYGMKGISNAIWDHLWPKGLAGFSKWFGVCVFGFGITPIAFNIQESMQDPRQMGKATYNAVIAVMALYVLTGTGVSVIYAPENNYDFVGQVLDHLPRTWVSTLVLLAMSTTTLMSAPLIMIPCGDLIMGKMGMGKNPSRMFSLIVRWTITIVITLISAMVPDFISVIAFVGNSCLSLVSFVFPPLIHIVLSSKMKHRKKGNAANDEETVSGDSEMGSCNDDSDSVQNKFVYIDMVMLAVGIIVTVFSTYTSLNHGS